MSSDFQHIVDQRVDLLAEAILNKIDVLAEFYNPPGGHIPLVDPVSSDEAYTMWSQHRYDDIGKMAVSRMQPADVAHLDAWLASETAARMNPALHSGVETRVPHYNPTLGEQTRQQQSAEIAGLGGGSPF